MKKKRDQTSVGKRYSRRGFIVRLLVGLLFISPLFVAILFSFVPDEELYGLPSVNRVLDTLTFDNYKWVFGKLRIVRFMSNSLVMCLICIVVQLLLGAMAAYAFSFFEFRGKNLLFSLVLVGMMIPSQVVVIANFLTIRNMGLVNTYLGLCLPSLIGGRTIYMLRQSFLTIPHELREATMMDGLGDIGFLFRFAVPLSVPSMVSLAMLLFIDIFNAYMWPLLVSRKEEMYTIQVGLASLLGGETPIYGRTLTGAVLSLIIPVGMFLIGQKYLIQGMTKGAVKG